MPARETPLPDECPKCPSNLRKTDDSLENLLIFLEMQTIYKPKMCEVPEFKERFEKNIDFMEIDVERMEATLEPLKNHTFGKYRRMNPKHIQQIYKELTSLGCIGKSGYIARKQLDKTVEKMMNYFMLEDLDGYFEDLQKGIYELDESHIMYFTKPTTGYRLKFKDDEDPTDNDDYRLEEILKKLSIK